MRNLLAALLWMALFIGQSTAGRAYSYIVDMAGAPLTTLTSFPGVSTYAGDLFYGYLAPAPSFEYATPSVVSFGATTTVPAVPGAPQSGNFAAKTDFYFNVGRSVGGAYTFGTDLIHATADLTGTVGIEPTGVGSSFAIFTNGVGTVVSGPNTGATSFASIDPNNGEAANAITLTYDGVPVTLYVDKIASLPAPNAGPLTISGYISDTVVPEQNGAVLIVTGLLALCVLRRRRE